MKLVAFNVNGIRARTHQLEALVNHHSPDIICIQESKVHDDLFPIEDINNLGYQVIYHGQKSHYGVATLYKSSPILEYLTSEKGFEDDPDDAQRRLITSSFSLSSNQKLHVINGYFPQGESRQHETKFPAKKKFYEDLNQHLKRLYSSEDMVVVAGDFNIAPEDKDIGIGSDNAKRWLKTGKCSFLPEEREWMETLCQWGLKDTYRYLYPEAEDRFSWFDYRSKGFEREPKRGLRIDMILTTEKLINHCTSTIIDYDIRSMEKPSDHCPVIATFDLENL